MLSLLRVSIAALLTLKSLPQRRHDFERYRNVTEASEMTDEAVYSRIAIINTRAGLDTRLIFILESFQSLVLFSQPLVLFSPLSHKTYHFNVVVFRRRLSRNHMPLRLNRISFGIRHCEK